MDYVLWIIFLVAMLIVEASTTNLVSIWFAAGALGAIVAKACGAQAVWQIAVMVAVSAIAIIIASPYIKKHHSAGIVATNADRIVGETGIVTDDINAEKFAGQVNVAGRQWSAVSADRSEIASGSKVKVKAISGVKLVVEKEERV